MTDLEAFKDLHQRLGVGVKDTGVWDSINEQYPHASAWEVENTCQRSYSMWTTYFFDSEGKFVTVGTWE